MEYYGDDIENILASTCDIFNIKYNDYREMETERIRLCAAAGMSAYLTAGLMNPLDCLRIRWQILPVSHSMASGGIVGFASHIVRTEGFVRGLWRPGVFANATGMGITASLRLGFYEDVRDALAGDQKDEKHSIHMILSGIICGAVSYPIATPYHLLKTKIQAQSSSGKIQCMLQSGLNMVKEHGIFSLWRGSVPLSVRGACFSAGQLYGKKSKKFKQLEIIYQCTTHF